MKHFFSRAIAYRLVCLLVFISTGPVLAQTTVVTTTPATVITEHVATLGGSVTSDVEIISRGFEYSLSENNPVIMPVEVGKGTGDYTYTISVHAGRHYTFRAVAVTKSGTRITGALAGFQATPDPALLGNPYPRAVVNTATPTYSGNVGGGDGSVTIYVDGKAIGQIPVYTSSFSATLPSPLAEGRHRVYTTLKQDSPQLSTSNAFTFRVDTTPPTAIISSSAGVVSGGRTATSPIPCVVQFSEALVGGFSERAVQVQNGTLSNFQPSGTTYSLLVTPTTSGTVTVSVPAAAARDSANNTNPAPSPFSFTYQPILPPTVTTDVPSIVASNYSFTSTSDAVVGGTVTSDGGAAVTARGIQYIQADYAHPGIFNQNMYQSAPRQALGTGTGHFNQTLGRLSNGYFYYMRAYATNQAGTSYGKDELFATVGIAPPIATERNTVYTTRTPTIAVSPVTNIPLNYPYQLFVYILQPGTQFASRLAVGRDGTATQPASAPLKDGNYIARSAIKVGTTREAMSTEDIPFSVHATR
jgi:hypothetical protein